MTSPIVLTTVHRSVFPRSKRILDLVTASVLVLVTAPLLVVIAAVVRRDGAPAIFCQQRVGTGGQPFGLRKFRSMDVDAEQQLGANPELKTLYRENG